MSGGLHGRGPPGARCSRAASRGGAGGEGDGRSGRAARREPGAAGSAAGGPGAGRRPPLGRRAVARRAGRRNLRVCGPVHGHLLPAVVPGPPPAPVPGRVLRRAPGGRAGRVPPLPAVPAAPGRARRPPHRGGRADLPVHRGAPGRAAPPGRARARAARRAPPGPEPARAREAVRPRRGHHAAAVRRRLPAEPPQGAPAGAGGGDACAVRRGLRVEQPAVRAGPGPPGDDPGRLPAGRAGDADRLHARRIAARPPARGRHAPRRLRRLPRGGGPGSRGRPAIGVPGGRDPPGRRRARAVGGGPDEPPARADAARRAAGRHPGHGVPAGGVGRAPGDPLRGHPIVRRDRARSRTAHGRAGRGPGVRPEPRRARDPVPPRGAGGRGPGRLPLGPRAQAGAPRPGAVSVSPCPRPGSRARRRGSARGRAARRAGSRPRPARPPGSGSPGSRCGRCRCAGWRSTRSRTRTRS